MKFFFQNPFSIKKVLIFGGFGLCRFQHKVGMNSFPMRMNVISYGTNSFPWGMYSFRSKIPIVFFRVFDTPWCVMVMASCSHLLSHYYFVILSFLPWKKSFRSVWQKMR